MKSKLVEKKVDLGSKWGKRTRRLLYIEGQPGAPSVFWSFDKDPQWYRNKRDALERVQPVKPEDYALEKSFFERHKKWIILSLIAVMLAAYIRWLLVSGRVTVHKLT